MDSDLPKVLHLLAGRPLVQHVVESARAAGLARSVVVVGYGAEQVRGFLASTYPQDVTFALQREQRGTGDAVRAALPELPADADRVVILSGDVPCLKSVTIRRLIENAEVATAKMSFATFKPENPGAYGRVLRDDAVRVRAIREARDATPDELKVDECNAGVYCIDRELLGELLPRIVPSNNQGEYYLTDIVALALEHGDVLGVDVDPREVAGINTKAELAAMEAQWERADGG